jgi:hypothetical protein
MMNTQTFVSDFIAEFTSHPECYEDVVDLLDCTIDDIVSNNTIEENKKIIFEYSGGVSVAMTLHEEYLGPMDELYSNVELMYQRLAFVSLFVKLYPIVDAAISDHCNFATFTQSFKVELLSNDDYYNGDMSMIIGEIISANSEDVNKQIISAYYVGYNVVQNLSAMIVQQLAFIALFSMLNHEVGSSVVR